MLDVVLMSVVVSGSIAYDYIMNYGGVFADHLLPEHIHSLSVSFNVDELQRNYGGTGLNIAYVLGQLECEHELVSAVGSDFDFPHRDLVHYDRVIQSDTVMTASAHIITDSNNNQITAFFPGAMNDAAQSEFTATDAQYCLLSPNGKEAALTHARMADKLEMDIVFHPGQQINIFDGDELSYFLSVSDYLYVNEYELSLIYDKTGLNKESVFDRVRGVICTYGAAGSVASIDGITHEVPAVPTPTVLDPTGAGDAYIGGVMAGLHMYDDWGKAMQMGTVCAHYCIQKYGTQNYSLSKDMVEKKMEEVYGF